MGQNSAMSRKDSEDTMSILDKRNEHEQSALLSTKRQKQPMLTDKERAAEAKAM